MLVGVIYRGGGGLPFLNVIGRKNRKMTLSLIWKALNFLIVQVPLLGDILLNIPLVNSHILIENALKRLILIGIGGLPKG